MSYQEYLSWVNFRNKNGPLDSGKKLDHTLALIAVTFAQIMFKKKSGEPFKLQDFSMWIQDIQSEKYGTVDEVYALLSSVAGGTPNGG